MPAPCSSASNADAKRWGIGKLICSCRPAGRTAQAQQSAATTAANLRRDAAWARQTKDQIVKNFDSRENCACQVEQPALRDTLQPGLLGFEAHYFGRAVKVKCTIFKTVSAGLLLAYSSVQKGGTGTAFWCAESFLLEDAPTLPVECGRTLRTRR